MSKLNKKLQSTTPLKVLLIAFIIISALISCAKEEKKIAKITFVDPVEFDLSRSSWVVGDSMTVIFQAEIDSGEMLPIQMGIGRYKTLTDAERIPQEVLVSEIFKTNQQIEIFTFRWKLPNTLPITDEDINYRLLISTSPERQPIDENPPLMINIKIAANNPE